MLNCASDWAIESKKMFVKKEKQLPEKNWYNIEYFSVKKQMTMHERVLIKTINVKEV